MRLTGLALLIWFCSLGSAYAQQAPPPITLAGIMQWLILLGVVGGGVWWLNRRKKQQPGTANDTTGQEQPEPTSPTPPAGHPLFNPAFVIGGILAVGLLVGVQQMTFLGETCYYVGERSLNTVCIDPGLYYGAWILAGLLLLGGLAQAFKQR